MDKRMSRWEYHYQQDVTYGNVGFKTLKNGGYPRFTISEVPIDEVGLHDFLKHEDKRIPLIIGSQFGFFPRLNRINGFFLEPRIIALLSKSVLSGCVAGLTICLIADSSKPWKVIKDFPEKHEFDHTSICTEINPNKDFGFDLATGGRLVVK